MQQEEVCMRSNYVRGKPQYLPAWQRLQYAAGPVEPPEMNGQVYFGDPYQYKQYLELRCAVNPLSGISPRLMAHQLQYDSFSTSPAATRMALPTSLQLGLEATQSLPAFTGYKTTALPSCGLMTSCSSMTSRGPVTSCCPVTSYCPMTSCGPVTSCCPVSTCGLESEQSRVEQILSPTLVNNNSAMDMTPPTSNPTSVHLEQEEEDEPELLLPEIPGCEEEYSDQQQQQTERTEPETPPCDLDDVLGLPPLDISSEYDIFSDTKLVGKTLAQALEQSLDQRVCPPVDTSVNQEPNVLTPDTTPIKQSVSSPRLCHIDTETSASLDIKAMFDQNLAKSNISSVLRLTEPTPRLDLKEQAGRGVKRPGKRGRKYKQCSTKHHKGNSCDQPIIDNHLLEKVMADTFLSNEHKTIDQFFDETLFIGGGGGMLPKQGSVRNMGRDYQHLVNSSRQDWGSSDVSVRIIQNNPTSTEYLSSPFPSDLLVDTSSLPSAALPEQIDFEKEFLF